MELTLPHEQSGELVGVESMPLGSPAAKIGYVAQLEEFVSADEEQANVR